MNTYDRMVETDSADEARFEIDMFNVCSNLSDLSAIS